MTPAAIIAKAESLSRYCRGRGCPLTEVAIFLTLGEGYELLTYIERGGLGRLAHHELLVDDCQKARLAGNPLVVLEHFQILGLGIARADRGLN